MLDLAGAEALAARAHAGQLDAIGAPYVAHVRAVASGLRPFGEHLQMAGLLHDILEDTPLTAAGLLEAGVPAEVVPTVQRVTRRPGQDYAAMVRDVAADRPACLVKISDNAHNSLPDRAAQLPPATRTRLASRYAAARRVLWAAAEQWEIEAIVSRVNPALLREL